MEILMHRGPQRRLVGTLLGVAFLLLALVAGTKAFAEEASVDGTIAVQARLDPATLGPGEEGFLVVESKIGHHLHIYAVGEEGNTTRWRPVNVPGVTYEMPAAELTWNAWLASPGRVAWSKPKLFADPDFPEMDPFPVWMEGHDFQLKIPVRLASSVAPGAKIGIEIDYSACDDLMCYDGVRGQQALVAVAGAAASPAKLLDPIGDDAVEISLVIDEKKSEAIVIFEPKAGYHVYMPESQEGQPIEVEPLADDGITWGDVAFEDEGGVIHEHYEVRIPFTREDGAERLRIRVSWQACNDTGNCFSPAEGILQAEWQAAQPVKPEPPMIAPTEPVASEAPVAPKIEVKEGQRVLVQAGEIVPFERVFGDDLDQPRTDGDWDVVDASNAPVETSNFAKRWKENSLLALLGVFVFGVLLAFTPCVLPIIPLTISIIGGGAAGKVSRGRLTVMLSTYVFGLSLAYGIAGAVSGFLGKAIDLEAAFRLPAVVWGLAIFFLLMAAGMLGIFELQPPAWMERLRGGAAQKSGTLIGSFLLGAVAALIASPCTGPFVISILAFVAITGNPWLGFLIFFVLGLGMGSVLFAAGSLNLLAKPGPWMVWIRYAFGVILVGVALYFLAAAGQLTGAWLFGVGFAIAILTWWGLSRHLIHREGERKGVALKRGAGMAIALALVTGIVAQLTHHEAPAVATPGGALVADDGEAWLRLTTLDRLKEELARAKMEKRPAVVDVWATWCHNCKLYDHVIETDPHLRAQFAKFVRLKIDETSVKQEASRLALGLPTGGQPRMAFLDEEGRIRVSAEIERWFGKDESIKELTRRVDFILGEADKTE